MDTTYHAVHIELHPDDIQLIENELSRVDEYIERFPRAAYHVEVEKSARKGGIGVSVNVSLSTRSLFATAWGGDLRSTAESVTDKLVRQAKRHLDRLRKDETAGAESPRGQGAWEPPTIAELEAARDIEDFSDRIAHHAARLQRFLRREIRLNPSWNRLRGSISLPDVVDDAIAYVYEHFSEKPRDMSPDRWLIRRGLISLQEEIDAAERSLSSGDGAVPASVDEQEEWEDLLDMPGPDSLPLDNQPAEDAQAAPDVLRDRRRAQQETAKALAGLPDSHRRSLVLRHLEGYEVPEIAYVLNTDDAHVESWLEQAEVIMRDRLARWRSL